MNEFGDVSHLFKSCIGRIIKIRSSEDRGFIRYNEALLDPKLIETFIEKELIERDRGGANIKKFDNVPLVLLSVHYCNYRSWKLTTSGFITVYSIEDQSKWVTFFPLSNQTSAADRDLVATSPEALEEQEMTNFKFHVHHFITKFMVQCPT